MGCRKLHIEENYSPLKVVHRAENPVQKVEQAFFFSPEKTGAGEYCYGFNGMEKDDEVKGEGNHYDFGLRNYDVRIARMFSVDPRAAEYSWQTSYAYHRNSPIASIDYLGGGDPSTHIDEQGNVIAEYDDGDNGVYMHDTGTTKEMIDENRNNCDSQCGTTNTDGNGNYIGELGGEIDMTSSDLFRSKLTETWLAAGTLSAVEWTGLVWPKSPWDLKNNEETIWGVAWKYDLSQKGKLEKDLYTSFSSVDYLFPTAADFGNFHAGFSGVAADVPTSYQKYVAGGGELAKSVFELDPVKFHKNYWNVPFTLGDAEIDYFWNEQGMGIALEIKRRFKEGVTK